MSDTVEDTAAAEAAEDGEQPTEAPPEDSTTEDSTEEPGNAEAARWRRKLREAETERDALAQRLEQVQRQQIETNLAAAGVKPEAVWAVAELPDLLADDGSIDTDKLTAAVEAARDKFGIVKTPKGNIVPGVGSQPNGLPKIDAWQEAFSPSRRR